MLLNPPKAIKLIGDVEICSGIFRIFFRAGNSGAGGSCAVRFDRVVFVGSGTCWEDVDDVAGLCPARFKRVVLVDNTCCDGSCDTFGGGNSEVWEDEADAGGFGAPRFDRVVFVGGGT